VSAILQTWKWRALWRRYARHWQPVLGGFRPGGEICRCRPVSLSKTPVPALV